MTHPDPSTDTPRRAGARLLTRLVATVLTGALLSAGAVLATASPAAASADELFQRLNSARASAGLPPLVRDAAVDAVAQRWTASIAADGDLAHNPDFSTQIPSGWTRAGENVAYGSSSSQIHQMWMDSSGHRANILHREYTSVGIGRVVDSSGRVWATQVFAAYPGVSAVAPAPVPLTGDWDGDGRDSVGSFTGGTFALPVKGGTVRFAFGRAGDVPVVGDWDADGKDEVGVFRAGKWYLRDQLSAGGADRAFGYGRAGDVPLTGRWDGRQEGIAVRRDNRWYLRSSVSGGSPTTSVAWGRSSDVPLAGDWDDDGRDSIGVWRAGTWYLAKSPDRHHLGRRPARERERPADRRGLGRGRPEHDGGRARHDRLLPRRPRRGHGHRHDDGRPLSPRGQPRRARR